MAWAFRSLKLSFGWRFRTQPGVGSTFGPRASIPGLTQNDTSQISSRTLQNPCVFLCHFQAIVSLIWCSSNAFVADVITALCTVPQSHIATWSPCARIALDKLSTASADLVWKMATLLGKIWKGESLGDSFSKSLHVSEPNQQIHDSTCKSCLTLMPFSSWTLVPDFMQNHQTFRAVSVCLELWINEPPRIESLWTAFSHVHAEFRNLAADPQRRCFLRVSTKLVSSVLHNIAAICSHNITKLSTVSLPGSVRVWVWSWPCAWWNAWTNRANAVKTLISAAANGARSAEVRRLQPMRQAPGQLRLCRLGYKQWDKGSPGPCFFLFNSEFGQTRFWCVALRRGTQR